MSYEAEVAEAEAAVGEALIARANAEAEVAAAKAEVAASSAALTAAEVEVALREAGFNRATAAGRLRLQALEAVDGAAAALRGGDGDERAFRLLDHARRRLAAAGDLDEPAAKLAVEDTVT